MSIQQSWSAEAPEAEGVSSVTMNRRQFLLDALPAAASIAIAAEAIWTPSRSIFLPPRGGWFSRSKGRFMLAGDTVLVDGVFWKNITQSGIVYPPTWLELRKLGLA